MINSLVRFWFAPADRSQYTAIRMGYAVTSLVHLLILWPLRAQFFSEHGMISGKSAGSNGLLPTLFRDSPSELVVTLYFIIAGLAMILVFVGVLPRLCSIFLAYWHYSLGIDILPATSGYDVILKLVGYIVAISPLGNPLWDRSANRLAETSPIYGLYLIRWQLLFIYWSTVWLKLADSYWRNGELISYFMMSVYSLFPSAWFAKAAGLSVILTYGTIIAEISIPFLLFSSRYRLLGLIVGLLLHGGIGATSTVWIFSLTMLMMYPAFVSRADLDQWADAFRKIRGSYRAA